MSELFITLLIITRCCIVLSQSLDFYFFIRKVVFCLVTDIILISSQFQCYSGGAISLVRYAWLYANLCIISVFHTAQYCVKNEWIFNTPRHKSHISFRLHLTSRGRLHAIRYLRLYSAVLSALSIFP